MTTTTTTTTDGVAAGPATRRHETTTVLGRRGEDRAAAWLSRQGFVVVEKNVRSRRGEVDLVCFEGATLCFVEVRARRSETHGTPAATVDGRKQRRIAHAALSYLARFQGELPICRFDIVEVSGTGRGSASFRLHRGAFEAPS